MGRWKPNASEHQQEHDQQIQQQPADVIAFPPPQELVEPQPFPPNQTSNQYYLPQQQQQPNVIGMQQFQQQPAALGQPAGIPLGTSHFPFISQPQLLPNEPWKTHLFGCMTDPQNAIITLLFPCVTFGQIAEILDFGSTSCGSSGIRYSLITFCIAVPCILSCTYRTKMRSYFRLTESPAPDWMVHCFCEYCALCQEYRELEQRGIDPSIGWLGNVAKQQQQRLQLGGMAPPMQQRMI